MSVVEGNQAMLQGAQSPINSSLITPNCTKFQEYLALLGINVPHRTGSKTSLEEFSSYTLKGL